MRVTGSIVAPIFPKRETNIQRGTLHEHWQFP
jgi:hypothetical protein